MTFNPTGNRQSFTVPPGVTILHVFLVGGRGGDGVGVVFQPGATGGAGAFGATVIADLPVVPGQVLAVDVGTNGAHPAFGDRGAGGFNGGAPGGFSAGGGGGATDIRTMPSARSTPWDRGRCRRRRRWWRIVRRSQCRRRRR